MLSPSSHHRIRKMVSHQLPLPTLVTRLQERKGTGGGKESHSGEPHLDRTQGRGEGKGERYRPGSALAYLEQDQQ